jgi:HEAT repeat protein
LKQRARDPSDRVRQEAVRSLAELRHLEAWKLVLAALADPESRVADEAEMALGKLAPALDAPEPKLRELVLGKEGFGKNDEWVRLRIAGALGAAGLALDAPSWNRLLGDKSVRVRRAACSSAERAALGQRLGDERPQLARALERLVATERSAEVRAAALCALAAVDGARASQLVNLALEQDAVELRAAAAHLSEHLPAADRDETLAQLLADAAPSVRAVALREQAMRPGAQVARLLAGRLSGEDSLRLRWAIVELLRSWSDARYGLDPRPWQEWAAKLAPDWRPALRTREPDPPESRSQVLGMPVLSQRICFLIDLSGSIWQQRADGRTRKSALDAELRRTLEALDEAVHFNLVPYTSAPVAWQPRLTPATRANVVKALEFFESRRDQGVGDFWSALEFAFADPEVDSVVMVGDGAPSGGKRWNLDHMASQFVELNRFRGVTLDAVLIDAKGQLAQKWRRLCGPSGGRVLEVNMP